MPNDVLILAYCYPPDNQVGALRPYRFAKYLPAHGYDTHVVTAMPQGADAPGNVHYAADWIQDRSRAWTKGARWIEAKIRRVAYSGGQPSLTWMRAAEQRAAALIEAARKPCSVITTSPPLGAHLAGLRLKKRYGTHIAWIVDCRDPIAHNPSAGKMAAFWNARLEKAIFAAADHLIANTDAAAERWRRMYPQWAGKISHLFNGFDPAQGIEPRPIPERGYKSVAHVGEIYAGRHPGRFAASFARLVDCGAAGAKRARLELIGDLDWRSIPDPALLNSLIERGAATLLPAPRSPREAVRAMCEADSLLLLDWDAGWQVPAKLYVYIRIGRPILAITGKGSPVDRLLARGGTPYACLYPEDTPAEADAKVTRFLELPSGPVAPSEWFLREFDVREQVVKLAGILENSLRAAQDRKDS